MIIEEEQQGKERAAYAESILRDLSKHLTIEYGKGFSKRNLEYFRQFYLTYRNRIAQSVIAQSSLQQNEPINTQSLIAFSEIFRLSWTHYIRLIKIENPKKENFMKSKYLRFTI